MNPKISVIVPVYKAEKYLHRCVDSILAQTFTDFEVLLIDDGSPDRSGEICDEYAQKDTRVRVFHKENGGVSSARNLGISYAKAKWITFVDSDDYIIYNMFERFVNYDKYEHVISGFKTFGITEREYSINKTEVLFLQEDDKIYNYLKSGNSMFLFCWGQFFLNKIIKENNICFDYKIKLGEDTNFVMNYLSYVRTSVKVKGFTYLYKLDGICVEKKYSFSAESFIAHILDLHKSVLIYEKAHSCNIQSFFRHNAHVYEKCLIYGLIKTKGFKNYSKAIDLLRESENCIFLSFYHRYCNKIINPSNKLFGFVLLQIFNLRGLLKNRIKYIFKSLK